MFIDCNSSELAVFLPGLGYTNDSPILYYIGSYLQQKEMNLLRVDYRYLENEEFMTLSSEDRKKWIAEDVEAVLDVVLSERKYERIIFIAKSIGTFALGEILQSREDLSGSELIWLTPLIKDGELFEKIRTVTNRSLLVIGTKDPSYNQESIANILEQSNIDSLIIEGANHSLEIENNLFESIHESKRILSKIIEFINH